MEPITAGNSSYGGITATFGRIITEDGAVGLPNFMEEVETYMT